jgi:PAS domain-containing protein
MWGLFVANRYGCLPRAVVYSLAHYWIESGSGNATAVVGMGLQGSSTENESQSTLPFPIADTEPVKQHEYNLLLQISELSWEQVRAYLAFGIVFIMMLHFLIAEVYAYMTQPGYFATASVHICQTGVFGAVGFIASGALRNSVNDNTDENGKIAGEATLVMASLAFQASPTAMAITDARGRIEKCNPAFALIASPSPEYQRYISGSALDSSNLSTAPTPFKDMLLETVFGLVNREDADRLQRCIDECQSVESDGYEGNASTGSHNEFLVHGKTLTVRVSLGSAVSGDAEQAVLPFSVLEFLSEKARLATQRSTSSAASKHFVVVVNDVTFDRSLVRAIHESTSLMHHGQSETLMKDMMNRINSTMQASHMRS